MYLALKVIVLINKNLYTVHGISGFELGEHLLRNTGCLQYLSIEKMIAHETTTPKYKLQTTKDCPNAFNNGHISNSIRKAVNCPKVKCDDI